MKLQQRERSQFEDAGQRSEAPALLPVFLKLRGRRCLVVGAGKVAVQKIQSLLAAQADVRVLAPQIHPEIAELAAAGRLEAVQRRFAPEDLDGVFLVIAATDDPAVNAAVYSTAVKRNVLCNSVDDPPNCDFYFGSVVTRGRLQVAVSTAGESPALAQRLRKEIDAQLPEDLGEWLDETGRLRREVRSRIPAGEGRTELLHQLARREVCGSPACQARVIAFGAAKRGRVYLAGAGPGDPDLLTTRAARLLATADVVLHDGLVPPAILRLSHPEALVLSVGKRCGVKKITQAAIHDLMIEHARAGRSVLRLKGGDPLVFGRAAEEIAALRRAGIPFEVVPGITAAFAAAAALGLSLTDRHASSSIHLRTGHHATGGPPEIPEPTRIVYMPGRDFTGLAAEWRSQGLPGNLPCVAISRAARPDQRIARTTLDDLDRIEPGPAPVLVIAGWVLEHGIEEAESLRGSAEDFLSQVAVSLQDVCCSQ